MRAAELGHCFASAVKGDLLVYPFYLTVQVEVGLEDFLRQAPASNRVAESMADPVRAMAGQRPEGIIARQRTGAFEHLDGAELLQGLV